MACFLLFSFNLTCPVHTAQLTARAQNAGDSRTSLLHTHVATIGWAL